VNAWAITSGQEARRGCRPLTCINAIAGSPIRRPESRHGCDRTGGVANKALMNGHTSGHYLINNPRSIHLADLHSLYSLFNVVRIDGFDCGLR